VPAGKLVILGAGNVGSNALAVSAWNGTRKFASLPGPKKDFPLCCENVSQA